MNKLLRKKTSLDQSQNRRKSVKRVKEVNNGTNDGSSQISIIETPDQERKQLKSHVKGAGIFETHELSGLHLSSNEFSNQDMDITPPESSEIGYFETQENNELKPEDIIKRRKKKKSSSKNKNKSKDFIPVASNDQSVSQADKLNEILKRRMGASDANRLLSGIIDKI